MTHLDKTKSSRWNTSVAMPPELSINRHVSANNRDTTYELLRSVHNGSIRAYIMAQGRDSKALDLALQHYYATSVNERCNVWLKRILECV